MSLARLRQRAGQHPAVPVVRLLVQISPARSATLLGLVFIRALLGAGFIVLVGRLLALSVHLADGGAAAGRAWWAFLLLSGVWVLQHLTATAHTLLVSWFTQRCDERTTGIVLQSALTPLGIGHLEDPARMDQLSLARGLGGDAYPPYSGVRPLTAVLSTRLSGLFAAVLLVGVLAWAPVPLAVAWALYGRYLARQFQVQVTGLEQRAGLTRRSSYLRTLGTSVAAAKEIRMLALGPWLIDRFSDSWRAAMVDLFGRRRANLAGAGWTVLLLASYLLVIGWLSRAALHHQLSIAGLMIGIQAAAAMSGFGWTGDSQWRLAGAAASIRAALALTTLPDRAAVPRSAAASTAQPASCRPVAEIRFAEVSFGYPGRAEKPADRLDLVIPAGRSTAVVGDNGAGKTTLVKLLARLYEPDTGQICVDGTPLPNLDPAGWRTQLAVVFQDPVRFQLTVRENIAFGRPGASVNLASLRAAAVRAEVSELIDALPDGWDTVLSRQFGGVDLSGGQWQRIALARALYAIEGGAQVLILDEPTAQLDARAESAFYTRFLELTQGLTTILISHRFNTVRLADQIAVLRAGRVIELGSHEQLMAHNGRYASMFRLQAERLGVR
jgi:ATP-binding cassette, subfamily B, bacterial